MQDLTVTTKNVSLFTLLIALASLPVLVEKKGKDFMTNGCLEAHMDGYVAKQSSVCWLVWFLDYRQTVQIMKMHINQISFYMSRSRYTICSHREFVLGPESKKQKNRLFSDIIQWWFGLNNKPFNGCKFAVKTITFSHSLFRLYKVQDFQVYCKTLSYELFLSASSRYMAA